MEHDARTIGSDGVVGLNAVVPHDGAVSSVDHWLWDMFVPFDADLNTNFLANRPMYIAGYFVVSMHIFGSSQCSTT